jgi:hypothetical protein
VKALKKLEDNVLEFYQYGYGKNPELPPTEAEWGTPLRGYTTLLEDYFQGAFIVREVKVASTLKFVLWPTPGVKRTKLKEYEGEFEGLTKTIKEEQSAEERKNYAVGFAKDAQKRSWREPKDFYEDGYSWNHAEHLAASDLAQERADEYTRQAELKLRYVFDGIVPDNFPRD